MTVRLIHSDAEEHILYIARVSSDQSKTSTGLIWYLIEHSHWSPFEMVSACIEVNTTRDIGRQILRHRSFSFQEFSQRYAEANEPIEHREMRLKGSTNRQGSLNETNTYFDSDLDDMAGYIFNEYKKALEAGVAPECARAILPEGYTPTRLYMHGTLRSWIHYLKERKKLKNGIPLAQREHYLIACAIEEILKPAYPVVFNALDELGYIDRL
jgi:thymidylate synthase (FAD)